MSPDGTDFRPVTTNPSSDTDASWSPDGRWIVYSSDYGGLPVPNIFVVSAAGGIPIRVTHDDTHEDVAPSWSPDGKWIAFESHEGPDEDAPSALWRIAVSNGDLTQFRRTAGEGIDFDHCATRLHGDSQMQLTVRYDGGHAVQPRTHPAVSHGVVLDGVPVTKFSGSAATADPDGSRLPCHWTQGSAGVATGVLAGTGSFRTLLPWPPYPRFGGRGLIWAAWACLPYRGVFFRGPGAMYWLRGGEGLGHLRRLLQRVSAYRAPGYGSSPSLTSWGRSL